MTKDDFYKTYLDDPLLIEKGHLTQERAKELKFHQATNNKLLEVIKIAINGNVNGESESVINRKINQSLNKES